MRLDALCFGLSEEIVYGPGNRRSLNPRPEKAMRKRIVGFERFVKQRHHAGVAPAVAGDNKPESVRGVDQCRREMLILKPEIVWEVLETVVPEIAVKLAVDRYSSLSIALPAAAEPSR